ncbi:MAG: transposase [Candidatus Acetothermia bacterium]
MGEVFTHLIERGDDPNSVKRVVSDKHPGMRQAIARLFPQALWQSAINIFKETPSENYRKGLN